MSTHNSGTAQSTRATVSRVAIRSGAVLIGLAAASVLIVQGSGAAFTASTANADNSLTAGTVSLSDSDSQAQMFNFPELNGGQIVSKCINVTYSGSLASDIHLYGASSGELAPGLAMTVELGSGATSMDCAGFDLESTEPLYKGTLSGFTSASSDYVTGIDGFSADGVAAVTKSYRITFTVSNENEYQGKTASADLTWEAQGKDAA